MIRKVTFDEWVEEVATASRTSPFYLKIGDRYYKAPLTYFSFKLVLVRRRVDDYRAMPFSDELLWPSVRNWKGQCVELVIRDKTGKYDERWFEANLRPISRTN